MRVLRVGVGILTSLLAIPVLIAGALAWWAMQHRSADGAFHAQLMPIESASRIVVVPDIDALLRRDAPVARAEKTSLRVKTDGFIGMADPADVAAYLAGVDYTELERLSLTRGPLPAHTRHVTGTGETLTDPQKQDFWVRRGAGELIWHPAEDRGRQVALVIVAPSATAGAPAGSDPAASAAIPPASSPADSLETGPVPVVLPGPEPIRVGVAVAAGWLNSTAWGLLILGPVLMLLGLTTLAWPQRPREIVYVMDTAAAVQAGLPAPPAPRPVVNLAYQPMQRYTPPAQLSWPPPSPPDETEPVREVDAVDRPMPIAGVHLHLNSPATARVERSAINPCRAKSTAAPEAGPERPGAGQESNPQWLGSP